MPVVTPAHKAHVRGWNHTDWFRTSKGRANLYIDKRYSAGDDAVVLVRVPDQLMNADDAAELSFYFKQLSKQLRSELPATEDSHAPL